MDVAQGPWRGDGGQRPPPEGKHRGRAGRPHRPACATAGRSPPPADGTTLPASGHTTSPSSRLHFVRHRHAAAAAAATADGCQGSPPLHLLALPNDLLAAVADFLPDNVLSLVCHRTWRLLRWRTVHHRLREDGGRRWVPRRQKNTSRGLIPDTHNLTISGRDFTLLGAPPSLTMLRYFESLTNLRLLLAQNTFGEEVAEALGRLGDLQCLQTLTLVLVCTRMGPRHVTALVGLRHAPRLETLHLDLSHNSLGDDGAGALAALRECPSLTSLSLHLSNTNLGPAAAPALLLLREARQLRRLQLVLTCNALRDAGAQRLASFLAEPRLTALNLNLCSNGIRDDGVWALADAGRRTAVPAWRVNVMGNVLSPAMRNALLEEVVGPNLVC